MEIAYDLPPQAPPQEFHDGLGDGVWLILLDEWDAHLDRDHIQAAKTIAVAMGAALLGC